MRTVGESGDKATRYETTSGQVRIGQDVRLPLTHTVDLVNYKVWGDDIQN